MKNDTIYQLQVKILLLCCVWVSLCAYSLTAQQTATAPRDAPWLLPTGTAQWPGAETQKYTQIRSHTHAAHSQNETFTQA